MAGSIVAWMIAALVGDVLRVRRAHVESAMQRAGIPDASGVARAMYRSLARGLVELLGMAVAPPDRRLSSEFPWTEIDAIVARGGAVVATAHTGSWDVVACAVACRNSLTVVTKRLSVGWLDGIWQRLRLARGLRLATAGSAARVAAKALGRGELVAMLVDQAPERTRAVTLVPFLGAAAWIDLAPALCAARARVPLIAAFPRRAEDGSHTLDIVARLEPPERPTRAWAVWAMSEVTRRLETFVLQHPEQWLWMHRRWKAGPTGARRASRSALAGATR